MMPVMKKILKIFVLLIVIITLLCLGSWYYVTSKVTDKINTQYAKKDIVILKTTHTSKSNNNPPITKDTNNYIIRFTSASAYGAPYQIAWNLNNFVEETASFHMEYLSPVKFGYDLLRQTIFIHYDGIINASYKPKNSGFGSKLVVKNYNIETFLPLSISLVRELSKSGNFGLLLNYIDNITLSNDNVSIFDLIDGEKFYEKEYETARIKFTAAKKYSNLDDFLSNIPQHYKITYDIKTQPNNAATRIVPASLFYGLMLVPSGHKVSLDIDLTTQGSNYNEFAKGLAVDTTAHSDSAYLQIHNLNSHYKVTNTSSLPQHYWKENLNFTIKKGFFDAAIKLYQSAAQTYPIDTIAPDFHQQMLHLIKNKKALHLDELENNKYHLGFDTNWTMDGQLMKQQLQDFTLSSDYSAIKLKHDFKYYLKSKAWQLNGILYINNYPPVIEYFSSYFYNISKYRNLGPQAHDVYIAANKDFARLISDHPKSKSNDLSFEYDINSANYANSKIGSVSLLEITPLYTLTIYQKLLDKVGSTGDILSKMKAIMPNIDENEPILKGILSKKSLTNILHRPQQDDSDPQENIGQTLFKQFIK
jgi:hypothetical protein